MGAASPWTWGAPVASGSQVSTPPDLSQSLLRLVSGPSGDRLERQAENDINKRVIQGAPCQLPVCLKYRSFVWTWDFAKPTWTNSQRFPLPVSSTCQPWVLFPHISFPSEVMGSDPESSHFTFRGKAMYIYPPQIPLCGASCTELPNFLLLSHHIFAQTWV